VSPAAPADAGPVVIGRRFNGPTTTANGGYACGVAAALVDGPAEVSLRAPVPLDTPLDVRRGTGGAVELLHGQLVVAQARPADPPPVKPPVRPSMADARAAVGKPWRGRPALFQDCYVCSAGRADGLGVDFGRLPGRSDCTAAVLLARRDAPNDAGVLAPEVVWGALDCPSYVPALWDLDQPSVLARMTAEILEPVLVGEPAVVVGWPLGSEARKHHAASALLGADGRLLARARALWVTLRG
jgi:hypothetical protein